MTRENVTQELEHIKSVNEKLLRLYRKADAKIKEIDEIVVLCGNDTSEAVYRIVQVLKEYGL